MLMGTSGNVLRCDVNGKVMMKCFLSGMPDVKVGLNDKLEVRRMPCACGRAFAGGWVACRAPRSASNTS